MGATYDADMVALLARPGRADPGFWAEAEALMKREFPQGGAVIVATPHRRRIITGPPRKGRDGFGVPLLLLVALVPTIATMTEAAWRLIS